MFTILCEWSTLVSFVFFIPNQCMDKDSWALRDSYRKHHHKIHKIRVFIMVEKIKLSSWQFDFSTSRVTLAVH